MKKYLLISKLLFIVTTALIIISSVLNIGFALILKRVVDLSLSNNLELYFKTIILSLGFLIVMSAVGFVTNIVKSKYIKKTMLAVKNDIFFKIMNKDFNSFNKKNTAEYISILTNDIQIIETDYFRGILSLIENVATLIIALYALISLNYYIALVAISMSLIPLLIPSLSNKRMSFLKLEYSDKLSIFTTKTKDVFQGFEVIKSFRIEKSIIEDYEKSNRNAEFSKYKLSIFKGLVGTISSFFGSLMFFATLGVGSYLSIKGIVTVGTVIAAVQLINNIVNPIVAISINHNEMKSIKNIETKISKMLQSSVNGIGKNEKNKFDRMIEFKNVTFSYQSEENIGNNVINDITFDIKKGQRYAIVGDSGSGKSTMIKLLLNYYSNFKGEILIDGLDIRKINPNSLYDLISVIQQNVYMFDDTIENNITLNKNYTENEVDKAIQQSGLGELVNSIDKGKNYNVGENGNKLSGGEKQRISIARAIIKKTPILVLDEATSSIDNKTAYNIEKSILELGDITLIVVTHKLVPEILTKYDEIFVLKEGNLIEKGTYKELIDRKGYFFNIYNPGDNLNKAFNS